MQGLELKLDGNETDLYLTIAPQEFVGDINVDVLLTYIDASEHRALFLIQDNLQSLVRSYQEAVKIDSSEKITQKVGQKRDAEVNFILAADDMQADVSITTAYGGKNPSLKSLVNLAKKANILRGLSKKRLAEICRQAKQQESGSVIEQTVAKGLPARHGRSSRLVPLVPNALERILRPQKSDGSRVDMRNLGDVLCTKAGSEILRRTAPTKGRSGFTVRGAALEPTAGEWVNFTPGEGASISPNDENLVLADVDGMPKFDDDTIWVDEVFVCNGVNVGSGNINYAGAVLVNGDVTEKMSIEAKGDVTINGFIESASIKAGGDIIITEGAMGKVNDTNTEYSALLQANGSIHIQHGQGLDIICGKSLTIGRQLAYSRINSGGGITVGPVDNPNGNLFACEIISQNCIIAGTIGAVSGSSLSIDFSSGFNSLVERKDSLEELLTQLRDNNIRHKERVNLIGGKSLPKELRDRFDQANDLLKSESNLLQWLQNKLEQLNKAKETYQKEINIIANKRMYPGVKVKLNNRTWRAEREYGKTKVEYADHQWHCEPLV